MKTDKNALLKHFSLMLKKRASGEKPTGINPNILKFFSRKELIEIIKQKFGGSVPKEHDLAELENEELLEIIGDEMFVLLYVTGMWSLEIANAITKPKPEASKEKDKPIPKKEEMKPPKKK